MQTAMETRAPRAVRTPDGIWVSADGTQRWDGMRWLPVGGQFVTVKVGNGLSGGAHAIHALLTVATLGIWSWVWLIHWVVAYCTREAITMQVPPGYRVVRGGGRVDVTPILPAAS